jgi:hypothetical protein
MKLGVLSFLAALVAAVPFAAEAADSSARFAVTVRATILERFTYSLTQSDGECRIARDGSGVTELEVRSIRPARVQVSGGSDAVVYRPSRLPVRLAGRSGGSFEEVRMCRGAPIQRSHRDCLAERLSPRVLRARFHRPRQTRIAFRRTPRSTEPVRLCGLGRRALLRAWLDLAQGSVNEDALLNGRSVRVLVRGSALREQPVLNESALNVRWRARVSWTLTFRRLR